MNRALGSQRALASSLYSPFPLSSQLLTHSATVGCHREGKVESSVQRQLKATVNKKLGRLHFGVAVGGQWEYYLQKEQGERKGKSKVGVGGGGGSRHKRWKKPPHPRCRRSQSGCVVWVRTGGCRGIEPRGPSLLLPPSSYSLSTLLSGDPKSMGQCGSALLLRLCCVAGKSEDFKSNYSGFHSNSVTKELSDLGQGWVLISQGMFLHL